MLARWLFGKLFADTQAQLERIEETLERNQKDMADLTQSFEELLGVFNDETNRLAVLISDLQVQVAKLLKDGGIPAAKEAEILASFEAISTRLKAVGVVVPPPPPPADPVEPVTPVTPA